MTEYSVDPSELLGPMTVALLGGIDADLRSVSATCARVINGYGDHGRVEAAGLFESLLAVLAAEQTRRRTVLYARDVP